MLNLSGSRASSTTLFAIGVNVSVAFGGKPPYCNELNLNQWSGDNGLLSFPGIITVLPVECFACSPKLLNEVRLRYVSIQKRLLLPEVIFVPGNHLASTKCHGPLLIACGC